ncbi:hypothetical protein D3C71_1484720 [compost metagenome]
MSARVPWRNKCRTSVAARHSPPFRTERRASQHGQLRFPARPSRRLGGRHFRPRRHRCDSKVFEQRRSLGRHASERVPVDSDTPSHAPRVPRLAAWAYRGRRRHSARRTAFQRDWQHAAGAFPRRTSPHDRASRAPERQARSRAPVVSVGDGPRSRSRLHRMGSPGSQIPARPIRRGRADLRRG